MRKTRAWITVAAWNLVLIALVFGGVELILRYSTFDTIRNPAALNPPGYYVSDDELGIRIANNQPRARFSFRGPGHEVFSNELGCFDTPVSLSPNERYILAIGDSFTWGYNALEDKWTSRLERRMGTRVLKCGVPGTGSRYQLALLKRLLGQLPHAPSMIIHLYDTTDFNDDFIFPSEKVVDGRRVEDYDLVRLSDGKHVPRGTRRAARSGQIYGSLQQTGPSGFVLTKLAKMGLTMSGQIRKRRSLVNGDEPDHLTWRYQFNLLLLDPDDYPYVSRRLDEHIGTLKEFHEVAEMSGARYVLFHTNSFRLPDDRPMVARLERYFQRAPGYLGRMPELDRHLFDPHWNAESEARVAETMFARLKSKGLLDDRPRISHRGVLSAVN